MWSDPANELVEMLRNSVPYYLVVALPILIMISPMPVDAAAEFTVYRLQQYDIHGSPHGSRNSLVNVEARTLDASALGRRCVLARLTDLTPAHYHRLISQGASALLVLLPPELKSLSEEQRKLVHDVEAAMLETETSLAVYFTTETEEMTEIYESVRTAANTDSAGSAAAALAGSLSSSGYQVLVSGSQSKVTTDLSIANIQGKLSGHGVEEQLPTIVLVAHYDAFGAAPELSFGGDSNGSGVVVLLELARLLHRLYSSHRTRPRINVAFLLSAGGYINYQGSKRFLEDHLDATDSALLSETHFALCLDTLANGDTLHLHVSKKPKETSAGHNFFQALEEAGASLGRKVVMVHKKINLQEDTQAWEHEKFSMRRLPAFTLSRLPSHRTGERGSVLDTHNVVDVASLTANTQIVSQALLKHIYNASVEDLLDNGLAVKEENIRSWLELVSSQPRSPQLLSGKSNPFVGNLHHVLSRFTSEAKVTHIRADKRDPEWAFYDVTKAVMSAYSVKPAAFDFVLTLAIIAYLGVIYAFLQYFPLMYNLMVRLLAPQKSKIL
ncbi:BOS complex subunit NCLN [Oratosquilla oratoria]|uniref:BOS complex subunit NCLN n=1 Tax=Oratosquilla oratoria TaxID=337810 RepID=UPI003F76F312